MGPVNFALGAGELGIITGGSGSGKTTVLDMLFGTKRASAGSVTLTIGTFSTDLLQLSTVSLIAARNRALAYGTQFFHGLASQSGFDLAMSSSTISSQEAERVFRRLSLAEAIWHKPVASYSGGEKQRLNVALAVLRRPKLLLLDEPLASIDASLHQAIWMLVEELREVGTATIVALHEPSAAPAAARHLADLRATEALCQPAFSNKPRQRTKR